MQLGSSNLTQKCATVSPGNTLISGVGIKRSKVTVMRLQKTLSMWFTPVSYYDCWLLLVGLLFVCAAVCVTSA